MAEAGRPLPISDANENLRLYSMKGWIEEVRHMILSGAAVDAAEAVEGNTPMMEAARCGEDEVVRELLRYGADVGLSNALQQTAMQLAVQKGHADVVRTLVRHGAPCRDARGWTALCDAASRGHGDVVRVLVDEGLRATCPGTEVDTTNMIGETSLMLCAAKGHTVVARHLVSLSADVDAQDMHGSTALMKAAGAGHTDMARYLLEIGAETNMSDDAGHTAVLYASRHGHLAVVRALVDFGGAAHTLGGKRMFDQPAYGPNAVNTMMTVPEPGRYLPGAGPSPFLTPSRLAGGPGGQDAAGPMPYMLGYSSGAKSYGLHNSLGLHALDMSGVSTLHTRGTLGSELSLPEIASAEPAPAPSNLEQIHDMRDNVYRSAGNEDYQQAKKRLLEKVFGPPPKVKEPDKPFKAADGTAFQTRQELKAYEEENLPFVCGACEARFGTDEELKVHFRKEHKPPGFLMEEAKAARERGTVDQAWLDLDLSELYKEQHELRTSIDRSLGDSSVDADELDNIIRQLRNCDVPRIALDRLLVALGDGETSEGDKALLLKYRPAEVGEQKAHIFDVLIMYQAHLKILYETYAKNPGREDAFNKEKFEMLLKDCSLIGADFKKNRSDQIFDRVVQYRQERNMDGTIKQAKSLSCSEFIHALIRIAYAKFGKLIGVHDKFLWLIKHFVLSHEKVIEVDDKMAVDMASKTVKAIVNDRKRNTSLKKTFARYGEKRDGQQVMTLTQFMGMLKSAEILPDDKQLLTDRECRFAFLSVNDEETATSEPMGGMTADSAVIVSYTGFLECLGRLARVKYILPFYDPEDTSKPGELKPFPPEYKRYIDEFMTKTQGLDFLALKRIGLSMKRKTKESANARDDPDAPKPAAPGLALAAEQLGQGVADMLEAESKARLAMFSVLANYGCKEETRAMLLQYLREAGVDDENLAMVEECLKEVEEGGKLKEKAKKVLVHFNIATSPEEELSIIQKKLEKATPVLEAVYIYYGAGLVFHSGGPAKTAPPEAPLGRLDAEGLFVMLQELEILKPQVPCPVGEDPWLPAKEYCTRLLDSLKAARPPPVLLDKDGNPLPLPEPSELPPPVPWEWPILECPQGQNPKKWAPVPGDCLSMDELKRLLVRLAYDQLKSFPGGIGARVEKLVADSAARHWCLTIDHHHPTLKKEYKSKPVQRLLSSKRGDLRKIFKELCPNWHHEGDMDIKNSCLYVEAANLAPCCYDNVAAGEARHAQLQRRLRYLFFAAFWRKDKKEKEMFDVWCKILMLICKDSAEMLETAQRGGEDRTWPLLELDEPEPEPEPGVEELEGAPKLKAPEKKVAFGTIFGEWLDATILHVKFPWKNELKKVRTKKDKEARKQQLAKMKEREKAEKAAKAAAEASFAAAE